MSDFSLRIRFRCSGFLSVRLLSVFVLVMLFCGQHAVAQSFSFLNVTDLPGGPGQGNAPSINDQGDIAFYQGTDVYFYDHSAKSFLDVTALPGAPAGAIFPKLNNLGNIAMMDPATRDLWLYEADVQAFTNISTLANYPGNSQANTSGDVFDLNDNNKISLHSGDLNTGTIYLYDHSAASFTEITGLGGGPTRGRENVINNADQVAYAGFPSLYIYDPVTDVATNVSNLSGGPGGGAGTSFAINDLGDAAIFSSSETVFYDASAGSFLYLSTLAGWPAGAASSNANDLSDDGEITFWRTDIQHFNPVDQSFDLLSNLPGETPEGGLASSINDFNQVAFAAGFFSVEDIFIGNPISSTFAADFDRDGDVDDSDFLDWKSSFAINAGGDADADGLSVGSDFLTWQRQFGSGVSELVVQVPEGSSLGLLVAAMVFLVASQRRGTFD